MRVSAVLVLLVSAIGFVEAALLRKSPFATRGPRCFHAFYYLFARHEPVFFVLTAVVSASALLPLWRVSSRVEKSTFQSRSLVFVAAAGMFLLTLVGARAVLHNYGLSMDEFASGYQARIFAAGRIFAPVPKELLRVARALTPVFILYDPLRQAWIAGFLPVYSAIRATFLMAGVEPWVNPVLSGISILLVGAVSRRLWPNWPKASGVAVAILCLSSQFVLMSMTQYSYPAHLCFNLLWLYLYLRPERTAFLLLPWVSVLALGLHNPVVHALFVAPFCFSLLKSRSRRETTYFGVVVFLGCVLWWKWLGLTSATSTAAGRISIFGLPNLSSLVLQSLNLGLVFSWQTPFAVVLLVFAVLSFRRLERAFKLLAIGAVVTYMFYWLYPADQQHGWGYRYIYGVLGNLVFLAAWAFRELDRAQFSRLARLCFAISAVSTVVVQIPLRCIQAEKFVKPFSAGARYLESLKGRVVLVDNDTAWYSQDYVRNDPFLRNDPLYLNMDLMTRGSWKLVESRFGSRIHHVTAWELATAKGEPEAANLAPCQQQSVNLDELLIP